VSVIESATLVDGSGGAGEISIQHTACSGQCPYHPVFRATDSDGQPQSHAFSYLVFDGGQQ
jgi:hypothetical protein